MVIILFKNVLNKYILTNHNRSKEDDEEESLDFYALKS